MNEENLKPFTGADDPRRNPHPPGRPKGRRSLSQIIKSVLESPIDWGKLPTKNEPLAKKYTDTVAWEALVFACYQQAMEGDTKAATWLSKAGYGDKIDMSVTELPTPILGDYPDVPEDDSSEEDQEPDKTN